MPEDQISGRDVAQSWPQSQKPTALALSTPTSVRTESFDWEAWRPTIMYWYLVKNWSLQLVMEKLAKAAEDLAKPGAAEEGQEPIPVTKRQLKARLHAWHAHKNRRSRPSAKDHGNSSAVTNIPIDRKRKLEGDGQSFDESLKSEGKQAYSGQHITQFPAYTTSLNSHDQYLIPLTDSWGTEPARPAHTKRAVSVSRKYSESVFPPPSPLQDEQLWTLSQSNSEQIAQSLLTVAHQSAFASPIDGGSKRLPHTPNVNTTVSQLEHAVKIQEQTLTEDHPDRLALQYELVQAYTANGQIAETVSLLEHIVRTYERTLGNSHPDLWNLQYYLADAYSKNGQYLESNQLLDRLAASEHLEYEADLDGSAGECEPPSISSDSRSSSSRTSGLSHQDHETVLREIEALFNSDRLLKSLYILAVRNPKIGHDLFKQQFRRFLKQFGSDLSQEAKSNNERAACSFVKSRASQISSAVYKWNRSDDVAHLQQIEGLTDQQYRDAQDERTRAFAEDQSNKNYRKLVAPARTENLHEKDKVLEDSEDEDDNPQSLGEIWDLQEVKKFVQQSKAFDYLRSRIRKFVYPEQLKWIQAELTSELDPPPSLLTNFWLHWDLLDYCESELDGSREICQVLTISGSEKDAFAERCENYIHRFWPRTGGLVLDCLQRAMQTMRHGISIFSSCRDTDVFRNQFAISTLHRCQVL